MSVNIESQSSHRTGKKRKVTTTTKQNQNTCYEELPAEIDVMKVFNYTDHDKASLFYHWGL